MIMKKNILKYIGVICVICGYTSCNDVLDKQPLDLARADTVRLSFFMRELAEPSEICIGTVGVSPVETEMLAPLRGEKVPETPDEKTGELFFID